MKEAVRTASCFFLPGSNKKRGDNDKHKQGDTEDDDFFKGLFCLFLVLNVKVFIGLVRQNKLLK